MPTLTAKSRAVIDGAYTTLVGLLNASAPIAAEWLQTWSSGSGSNQANRVFTAKGSAAGAAVNFDLTGGSLTDIFGDTLNLTKVKEVRIYNKATTTLFDLTIGGDWFLTQVLSGWVDDAVGLPLGPGGQFVQSHPVDGWTVSAPASDRLTIDPGANTISYELMILGVE